MRRQLEAATTLALVGLLTACGGGDAAPAAARPAASTRSNDAELRGRLAPLQYEVTQLGATEAPFDNPYWDHHEPGVYVDVVSGEPLFSSTDKFDSGTGWPSFTRPLVEANVVRSSGGFPALMGVEVHSRHAGSHLGHVFSDGPAPTGLRYCINSASLGFVPAAELGDQGLGDYTNLFPK